MENKIIEFIEKNKLNLNDSGSGLNSTCTILAGYCLYLGVEDVDDLLVKLADWLDEKEIDEDIFDKEFKRVFNYAKEHDYGKFWTSEEAKNMYVIL